MNIQIDNREDRSSLIKVTVGEADYKEAVDTTLRQYRRKANVPGFRPGMVPMGIINKMYRKGAVAEEAYKTASKACFDYIEQEKIDIIGDVIPAEDQVEMDFDNNTEFEFAFEIGRAPEVNISLDGKDKLTKYTIEIDDKMFENYRSNFLRRYGRLIDVDKVESDEALTVTLDNEQMNVEDAYVGLISMNEDERKPFIGKKVGDTMDVDVNELYTNTAQRAAILQVKEEELAGIDPKFKLTITKIRKFAEPELNEEFFKMAFPDGSVSDEKGLDEFIRAQITRDMGRESELLFTFQVRKLLLEKANLEMPEAFLKRWLYTVNEGKFTMEQINSDFAQFLDMMRWNLIQNHYAKTLDLKVTPEEAMEEAKGLAMQQFAQYGMTQVQDDMLTNYAGQILSNQEEARKIYDKLYEHKVLEAVSPMLAVTEKAVSADDFSTAAQKITA